MTKTEQYKRNYPLLALLHNRDFGGDQWEAILDETKPFPSYTIKPVDHKGSASPEEELRERLEELRYEELQIAETDKTGFVWLELTNEQAVLCIVSGLFEVYARFDDESETLVETLEEYTELSEVGIPFYLEVGHIDPDFFKMQG